MYWPIGSFRNGTLPGFRNGGEDAALADARRPPIGPSAPAAATPAPACRIRRRLTAGRESKGEVMPQRFGTVDAVPCMGFGEQPVNDPERHARLSAFETAAETKLAARSVTLPDLAHCRDAIGYGLARRSGSGGDLCVGLAVRVRLVQPAGDRE